MNKGIASDATNTLAPQCISSVGVQALETQDSPSGVQIIKGQVTIPLPPCRKIK